MYGGTVYAEGRDGGAGIGGGDDGDGGEITINGGAVTATGADNYPGIYSTVTLGRNVTVWAGNSPNPKATGKIVTDTAPPAGTASRYMCMPRSARPCSLARIWCWTAPCVSASMWPCPAALTPTAHPWNPLSAEAIPGTSPRRSVSTTSMLSPARCTPPSKWQAGQGGVPLRRGRHGGGQPFRCGVSGRGGGSLRGESETLRQGRRGA